MSQTKPEFEKFSPSVGSGTRACDSRVLFCLFILLERLKRKGLPMDEIRHRELFKLDNCLETCINYECISSDEFSAVKAFCADAEPRRDLESSHPLVDKLIDSLTAYNGGPPDRVLTPFTSDHMFPTPLDQPLPSSPFPTAFPGGPVPFPPSPAHPSGRAQAPQVYPPYPYAPNMFRQQRSPNTRSPHKPMGGHGRQGGGDALSFKPSAHPVPLLGSDPSGLAPAPGFPPLTE